MFRQCTKAFSKPYLRGFQIPIITQSLVTRPQQVSRAQYGTFTPPSGSSIFLEDLELQWKQNPQSVSSEWRDFFDKGTSSNIRIFRRSQTSPSEAISGVNSKVVESALFLIDAYQTTGHRLSSLDPLNLR